MILILFHLISRVILRNNIYSLIYIEMTEIVYNKNMKKKLSPEQEALLNKFKNSDKTSAKSSIDNKNEKVQSNAPKPQIRRSGSRGK